MTDSRINPTWGPNTPNRAPTPDECSTNARVKMPSNCGNESEYQACWYPQVGGYHALCWIETSANLEGDACFDAFVWHDGEFPTNPGEEPPFSIHYCDPQQLIDFAELARAFALDQYAVFAKEHPCNNTNCDRGSGHNGVCSAPWPPVAATEA
jgi:hypothetical protein